MSKIYYIIRKYFIYKYKNLHISSKLYLGVHPKSIFAKSQLAYIDSMSPSRRASIVYGTLTPVTFSKVFTNSNTDVPCPLPKL